MYHIRSAMTDDFSKGGYLKGGYYWDKTINGYKWIYDNSHTNKIPSEKDSHTQNIISHKRKQNYKHIHKKRKII